ncbi:hypothetical protein DFJ67_4907 [Asanoa ferruginea]|uniref:YCII-related domain-containing protein n=1 Tax=Asanoa ferruginea TaxID=53367 RepID=A0A3D9ZQX5_9ACTN|nr:YciI family protein [Asanoa ferruginea]REF98882.1 hypothetical protein DFJ67_4907 [Asanoa ferruginea]
MAKYILFIHDDEAQLAGASQEVIASVLEGHQKFAAQHGPALRGGGRLAPTTAAQAVRGDTVATGPFTAGTTTAIGGYYIVEADSPERAGEIAKDVPAPFGGVEVRELV